LVDSVLVTYYTSRRYINMKRMIVLAALLLAACGSKAAATPAVSVSPAVSTSTTPAPTIAPSTAVTARFVSTAPSSSKVASAQSEPWIDVVAFDEVGLTPGQTVSYQVAGSATASYTCGGKSQTASGPVSATRTFTADATGEISEVIAVQPPALQPGACATNYPGGIWGFKYETLHLADRTNNVGEDVPGMSGGA
jgi:hypothetical protein